MARFSGSKALSAASPSSGLDNPPQPYRKDVKTSSASRRRCEVRVSPTGSPVTHFSIHQQEHGLKHTCPTPTVLHMLVNIQRAGRSLPSWLPSAISTCSGNIGFFKNPVTSCECLCCNPRCWVWGCCKLSTAADYDLPLALAGVRFCQLKIVWNSGNS